MKNLKRNSSLALLGLGVIMVFNGCSKLASLKLIVGLWILATLNCAYINDEVTIISGSTSTTLNEESTVISGGVETETITNTTSALGVTSQTITETITDVTEQIDIRDDGTFTFTRTETPRQRTVTTGGVPNTEVFVNESSTETDTGNWYFSNSDKKNSGIMLGWLGEWHIKEIDKKQMNNTRQVTESWVESETDYNYNRDQSWNYDWVWNKQ